ncbi:tyrosine-type recombinase/integrase [Pseudorhodoferax soli]|uniref:Site-specific recombinase XerD n=1 Tax=Pseudorhodoferax soli TaxID=545864 RepID=A0A368XD50_9BURK|nr:site-specific integrase [Pseudorhodoferax soli]RCW65166.1 site-specific recombinase XerD [Pseudorhodoferax soli]
MAKSFVKLDRRELRKLKPGQKVMEHGISFQRLENGDGVYTVNVMVDGQRIHRVVGRESEGVTRSQAEEFIEKARTDARHDRLALPKGRKVVLSFNDAAVKYIARLKESGGKNIDTKEQHLQQHLVPFFSGKPLGKIVAFDIERYKKHRLAQVVQAGGDWRSGKRVARETGRTTSPGTVNREIATLSHLFNQAVEWEWIVARPRMRRMAEGTGRIVYLTAEQVQRFLAACMASDNGQLYPFALIALETSMRKSEVLSVRKENIRLDRRMIYLPKAKAGAREQPITDRLAGFLEQYMRDSVPAKSPWLFPSDLSKSGHTVALEKPFRTAATAAGLDPAQVVRHTLRHTAVSHLVQSGVDLPTVKRISGHKTLQMVERYAHQDGEHIQAAMDKLQARLTHKA